VSRFDEHREAVEALEEGRSYVDDPIGLALIDLYELCDKVTVVAYLDDRWVVTMTATTDDTPVWAAGRSVGAFDPTEAFLQAVEALTAKLDPPPPAAPPSTFTVR
jgi:hypothetical protein